MRKWQTVVAIAALSLTVTSVFWVFFGPRYFDLDVYLAYSEPILSGRDSLYEYLPGREYPFTYPPFAALLFAPLNLLPVGIVGAALTLSSLAALGRVIWLVLSELGMNSPSRFVAAFGCGILLEPVLENLGYGQVNLLLMWLICEDLIGRLGRGRLLGLGVGLAMGIKLTPGIFLLYLLAARKWRGALVAAVTGAVTGLIGFSVLPASSWDFWTRAMISPERLGGQEYASNQSIGGALWRAFGPGGFKELWVVLVIAVLGMAYLAVVRVRHDKLSGLMIAALSGLLISPVSWSHHWAWVVPLIPILYAGGQQVLAGAWVFTTLSWIIWWLPHTAGREYFQPWWGKILTNSYTILAVVTIPLLVRASAVISSARHMDLGPSGGSEDDEAR